MQCVDLLLDLLASDSGQNKTASWLLCFLWFTIFNCKEVVDKRTILFAIQSSLSEMECLYLLKHAQSINDMDSNGDQLWQCF